mgnify:CR=1 FL=1
MLESIQLSKSFGKLKVLKDMSVQMRAGQTISLIGPNGSGKTTFIKCLLGLVIPDSGSINLYGNNVLGGWDYRRYIGYMPQSVELLDGTVAENIARLGSLNADMVVAAAKLAGVHGIGVCLELVAG